MGRIEEFLRIQKTKSTRNVYRSAILEFLDFIYGRIRKRQVTKKMIDEYERLADRYFSENRDHFQDLLNFVVYLSERPPKTIVTYFNAVKQFLEINKIVLTPEQMKFIKSKLPKGAKAVTIDENLDKEMIRRILEHCDIRLKAIVLVLASSGMRIGELLQIRFSDLRLEKDPPEIEVRSIYTKSNESRIVYISQEAKRTLEEWLKVRDSYLERAKARAKGLSKRKGKNKDQKKNKNQEKDDDEDKDRVFPFTQQVIEEAFINAVKKAGLFREDPVTKRATIHLHSLRKFFRSAMLYVGCPFEIVEGLLGHSTYLAEAYRRFTPKQIAEWYKRCEHAVTIYGSQAVEDLRKELEKRQKELKRKEDELEQRIKEIEQRVMAEMEMKLRQESIIHRATVEGLVKDKIELEHRIKKLERQIDELRDFMLRLLHGKVKAVPFAKSDQDIFEKIKNEMPEFVLEE